MCKIWRASWAASSTFFCFFPAPQPVWTWSCSLLLSLPLFFFFFFSFWWFCVLFQDWGLGTLVPTEDDDTVPEACGRGTGQGRSRSQAPEGRRVHACVRACVCLKIRIEWLAATGMLAESETEKEREGREREKYESGTVHRVRVQSVLYSLKSHRPYQRETHRPQAAPARARSGAVIPPPPAPLAGSTATAGVPTGSGTWGLNRVSQWPFSSAAICSQH